eukprot:m.152962 g.152962  ORF g.152962 m.152962 type:complete len:425 (+) comp30820_c0_seq2:75-1349(+)
MDFSRVAVMFLGCVAVVSAASGLYGVSTTQSIVKINPTTGAQTPIGSPLKFELSAQQLSTIDIKRGIYYALDYNTSTKAVNLVGVDVDTGTIVVDLAIAVQESMFVGVDQGVDVDPITGVVIISAHDSTVMGHHIFSVDPHSTTPNKITSIAKIPAPAVQLLGGCSCVDWDLGIFYSPLVMPKTGEVADVSGWMGANVTMQSIKLGLDGEYAPVSKSDAPPPPPVPPFQVELMAIHYKGAKVGTITPVKIPSNVGTLQYDYATKAIVGFSGKQTTGGGYVKTLASIKTADMGATWTFATIGTVKGYVGEMGPISTIDSVARSHFSLLQPASPPWQASDKCAATGFPCKTGTSCCQMPPGGPACFSVASCSDMHNAPNISAPFYLVELNLDTAATVGKPPPICTIQSGCPWSLESAEKYPGVSEM